MDQDLKILVVDDFATMRHIFKNVLRELGYQNISEADDGVTALPMLKQNNYGLLITDWNMPEMQGIDLLKAVRAEEKTKELPVLMVTAEARKDQVIEAAEAGVNGYIIKPFNTHTLQEKINKIFADYE